MRYVLLPLCFSSLIYAASVNAQSGDYIIEGDLQEEVYRESRGYGGREVVELPARELPSQQNQNVNQKVLILSRSSQVQQQPITNVEASPLTDSRAAQLRRAREDAEVSTEQKIVEKLEQSRLEDEKRRAEALFGSRLENQNPYSQQEVVAPAGLGVQVLPANQEVERESLSNMKDEIISSVRDELRAKSSAEKPEDKMYISGAIGVANYEGAVNVDSNEALGLSVGTRLDGNYIVEGSFMYSNHYVDSVARGYGRSFVYDDLDQYNFIVAAKYAPQFGRISPQVGALVSYTHRKYTEVNYRSSYFNNRSSISNESETDAFDIGLSVGLDIKLGENFVIGAEYRYITNLTSKSNSRFLNDYYSFYDIGSPLEEFDYYTFGIVGKILF